jgi:hypothetical protein
VIVSKDQFDVNENKECLLGDLMLNNHDESKLLMFLGAQETNTGKWRIKMGISRKCEEDLKDGKLHIINSDCMSYYSFDMHIDAKIGEKIRFSEDFGSNISTEQEMGIIRSKIEKVKKFYSAQYITLKEIEKDRILFDVKYL